MTERIQQLLAEVNAWSAKGAEELEALRIKYLSKKGEISLLFNDFREVPNELKREVGQQLNVLKDKAQERLNELKAQFGTTGNTDADADYSRSAYPIGLGTRHPLSIVKNEIVDIFARLGFTIAEGPEIAVSYTHLRA